MFFLFLCCYDNGGLQFVSWDEPKGTNTWFVCFDVFIKFNLKNLSYFISKLPHDLLVIVCGSKECTQNLLTFCNNTLYKKLNSIPCDKCLGKNTMWYHNLWPNYKWCKLINTLHLAHTSCGIIVYASWCGNSKDEVVCKMWDIYKFEPIVNGLWMCY
jgi:hypothetical protein